MTIAAEETLVFGRGDGFTCAVNLSSRPVRLPEHTAVVLSSAPLPEGSDHLPADTAVWPQR